MSAPVQNVIDVLQSNRWMTAGQVSLATGIKQSTVQKILTLGEGKVFALDSVQRWCLKKAIRPGGIDELHRNFINLPPAIKSISTQNNSVNGSTNRGSKSIYSVYVIELDNNPKKVYVGQTFHTPQKRLEQHNSGMLTKYAAKVFRKGSRGILRPDLYGHVGSIHSRPAARRAEALLANELLEKGYEVFSDGLKFQSTVSLKSVQKDISVKNILSAMDTKKGMSAGRIALKAHLNLIETISILQLGINRIFTVDKDNLWKKRKNISDDSLNDFISSIGKIDLTDITLHASYEKREVKRHSRVSSSQKKTLKHKARKKSVGAKSKTIDKLPVTHRNGAIVTTKRKFYTGPTGQYWTDPNYQKKDYEGGI